MNSNPVANGPGPSRARPVEEIRLGAIRAAIWRNDTESGVRHNVTFERIYRDGDEWRSTASFGRDDLLLLGKVADQAHSWIHTQAREASAATSPVPTSIADAASTTPNSANTRRRPGGPLTKGTLPSAPAGA